MSLYRLQNGRKWQIETFCLCGRNNCAAWNSALNRFHHISQLEKHRNSLALSQEHLAFQDKVFEGISHQHLRNRTSFTIHCYSNVTICYNILQCFTCLWDSQIQIPTLHSKACWSFSMSFLVWGGNCQTIVSWVCIVRRPCKWHLGKNKSYGHLIRPDSENRRTSDTADRRGNMQLTYDLISAICNRMIFEKLLQFEKLLAAALCLDALFCRAVWPESMRVVFISQHLWSNRYVPLLLSSIHLLVHSCFEDFRSAI